MTAMQFAMQKALKADIRRRLAVVLGQRDELARLLLDSPNDPAREAKQQAALREVEIDIIRLLSQLEAAGHDV